MCKALDGCGDTGQQIDIGCGHGGHSYLSQHTCFSSAHLLVWADAVSSVLRQGIKMLCHL